MPVLNGYSTVGSPVGYTQPTAAPAVAAPAGAGATLVVDGTPVRVVMLALAAAAGIAALRWAGFRFNVGV